MLSTVVAALVAGCGSGNVTSVPRPTVETLTLSANTSSLVAGTYVRDSVGVRFSVSASDMLLEDMTGARLVEYIANPDGTTTMYILDMASVLGWVDASGNDEEIDSGDVDGATSLLIGRPEMAVVPYLSPALAAAGASGMANAMSMQLHALASQLSQATGVDPTTPVTTTSTSSTCELSGDMAMTMADMASGSASGDMATTTADMASASASGDMASASGDMATASGDMASLTASRRAPAADECQDLTSDPYCNKCLGMCGPGCTCWQWVCGDCCWHQGCYQHDTHCRACDASHKRDCLLCALFDFGRPYFTC